MMEHFSCSTRIVSGSGSSAYLRELNIQRLMMVTDPFFYKNGTAQRIAQAAAPKEIAYFHEIKPDPDLTLVAKGTEALQAFRPDTVVALGGGSAMDCAKAMCYFSGLSPRLVAIPTTSGSGSEVTDFAILTHQGVKHPLVDEALRPQIAILDSDLLAQLPPALIADGGFDAMTHALEAYTAANAGEITDALALSAFRNVFKLLPRSFGGDQTVRPAIHLSATMAGISFTQAGLGVCHALSHSLGGQFHIPHGRLNAIILPAVISCNASGAGEKYAALAQAIGLEGRAVSLGVRNLRNALIKLRQELNLPATLCQTGISPLDVRQKSHSIVEAVLSDPCCHTNPVTVTEAMVHTILREVTGHG